MNFLERHRLWVKPMASDLAAVRRRALVIAAVLVLGAAAVVAKTARIAVTEHEAWTDRGNRQQLRNYTLTPSRGDVVDRGHIALAVDDRVYRLVINPRLIRSQGHDDEVARALAEIVPDADLAYLRDELGRDKAYRQLRYVLDDAQAEQVRARKLPGVRLEDESRRIYPRRLLAAHVLGRVGGEDRGNLGAEYGLDSWLRGREASSPAFFAAGQKLLVEGRPSAEVSRGHTVVLTLDSAIQAMAEEELDALVETWKPRGASVIVLEPSSGEVLAVANRPTFDPNRPVEHLEQTVNLAVSAAYEPGSTIKAITVAAALEQGTIRRDQTFFCEGGRWQYTPEHSISDTKPTEWLGVTEILAVSSNICTTKIYETLGKRALHRWVERFHFGERPDVPLPGATEGLVAPWEKWSDIQAANVSFGQGMSASPLQVAAAFAALANHGEYHAPKFVRAVLGADGQPVWKPEHEGERLVRAATAHVVMEMLESVVQSKLGTGKNARIAGYRVAGKTSTAQKASNRGGYEEDLYYASFVGAVPARAARVVILVSVDVPQGEHYGNDVAAPTFARLGERIMTHYGVPREDGSVPVPERVDLDHDDDKVVAGFIPDVDVEPELPGRRKVPFTTGLPDFTGLTLAEAFDAAEQAKIELLAVGTGIAVMQDTPPGPVDSGATVRVLFQAPS